MVEQLVFYAEKCDTRPHGTSASVLALYMECLYSKTMSCQARGAEAILQNLSWGPKEAKHAHT